jgi:hypothetical protein
MGHRGCVSRLRCIGPRRFLTHIPFIDHSICNNAVVTATFVIWCSVTVKPKIKTKTIVNRCEGGYVVSKIYVYIYMFMLEGGNYDFVGLNYSNYSSFIALC